MGDLRKMNAMTLYVATCRYVIQANPSDQETWADLYRYLPYLRQALSCCVCTKLLLCPMGPVESACLHHVCRDCVGGKMRMKPSCSWCKDYDSFVENLQLRLIVKCFKKLCKYISASQIGRRIATEDGNNGITNNLLMILQEASEFQDDFETGGRAFSANLLSSIPANFARNNIINKLSTSVVESSQGNQRSSVGEQGQGHTHRQRSASQTSPHGRQQHGHGGRPLPCASSPKYEQTHELTNGSPTSNKSDNCDLQTGHVSSNGNIDAQLVKSETLCEINAQSTHRHRSHRSNSDQTDNAFRVSLAQSIAAEHDYNILTPPEDEQECVTSNLERRRQTSGSGTTTPSRRCSVRIGSTDGDEEARNVIADGHEQQPPRKAARSGSARSPKKQKPKGCQCGNATPNPGKLTCYGQRCPCYSAHKGCTDCRCRGCRNPRKEVKVESFSDAANDGSSDVDIEVDN